MTVNILGTEYEIKVVKISECEELKINTWVGSCNKYTHVILLGDSREEKYFGKTTCEERSLITKRILRHEIIHAFFFESGLQDDANVYSDPWPGNEELVDWIAIQFPKILKAFTECECL